MNLETEIKAKVRNVPNFPKEGINFKDVSTLLLEPKLCTAIVAEMKQYAQGLGVTKIVGVESRGFIFGMPLALALEIPFVLVRKKGKLPAETVSYKYELEYGFAEVEIHSDSINSSDKVLIHDDLLATGGTAIAAAELVKQLGGEIAGFSFLIDLSFLGGTEKLLPLSKNINCLATYNS